MKIKKLTQNGTGIAPATFTAAVVDDATSKTLKEMLAALSGAISSGKSDLSAAVDALNSALAATTWGDLAGAISAIDTILEGTDSDEIIDKWKEIEAFLNGISDTETLTGLLNDTLTQAKAYADEAVAKGEIEPATSSKLGGVLSGGDIAVSETGVVTVSHATSADSATNADHATSADSATSADKATEADHATSADSATSADKATEADHATSADSATSATTATKLGSDTVGSSTTPIYLNGGTAAACGSSLAVDITGNAATATKATSADTATNATSADKATEADHATSADTATSATTANKATEADHATSADSATTATSATKATQDGNGNTITTTYATAKDLDYHLEGWATYSISDDNNVNKYIKVCTVTRTGMYNNSPVRWFVSQRSRKGAILTLVITSGDLSDATVRAFCYEGDLCAAYLSTTLSEDETARSYDIYIQANESYDYISITPFNIDHNLLDDLTFDYTGEIVEELPENVIEATLFNPASQLGSDTVGSSTTPIYLNEGTATACGSSLAVDITGNAATATKATSADTATTATSADTATSATTADSATKATQDGEGNVITTTYAKATDALTAEACTDTTEYPDIDI